MDTLASNLFFLLRRQAARHTHAIATRSSRRAISYRRIWSRIERATARLQCEWQVQPGDVIAYWGNAHADALILYFAVARCGARLLPMERAEVRAQAHEIGRLYSPRIVIHDEGMPLPVDLSADVVATLPELLAIRCSQQAQAVEDSSLVSLIDLQVESGSLVQHGYTLAELGRDLAHAEDEMEHVTVKVGHVLFDVPFFMNQVLPALTRAHTLSFS